MKRMQASGEAFFIELKIKLRIHSSHPIFTAKYDRSVLSVIRVIPGIANDLISSSESNGRN